MADRPKVGAADPETRRKKLRELLDEPTRSTGVNRDKKPETMKDAVDAGVEMGSDKPKPGRRTPPPKVKKKPLVRRFGPQGKTMDEVEAE